MLTREELIKSFARTREVRVKRGAHPKYSYLRGKFYNQVESELETGWDYPIRIDISRILGRFEGNHNRLNFKGTDEDYFNLIKKAIVICCRMAEHFREDTLNYERYRLDSILITGGGGANSKYTIGCIRNISYWQMLIGEVEIDFREKTLKVWMNHWSEEGKNSYTDKKEYTKPINNIGELLNTFHKKYYCKE